MACIVSYRLSPRIGWPIAHRCTRSWWVRPVTGWSSTRVECSTHDAPSLLVLLVLLLLLLVLVLLLLLLVLVLLLLLLLLLLTPFVLRPITRHLVTAGLPDS